MTSDTSQLRQIEEDIQQAFNALRQGNSQPAKKIIGLLSNPELKDVLGDNHELQLQFADLSLELGNLEQAIHLYRALLSAGDNNATLLGKLARAYILLQDLPQAEHYLSQAFQLDSSIGSVASDLGAVRINLGKSAEALQPLETACKLMPEFAGNFCNLAQALLETGQQHLAISAAKQCLQLEPSSADALFFIGRAHAELGEFDRAQTAFKQAVQSNPQLGLAYYWLAQTKKHSTDDVATTQIFTQALEITESPLDKAKIHLALGKLYDDCKQWDEAFTHFDKGNRIEHEHFQGGPPQAYGNTIRELFSTPSIEQYARKDSGSITPIFIVGMPRSGSTLIERLLITHPEVATAGETPFLDEVAERFYHQYPSDQDAHKIEHAFLDELARSYEEKLIHASHRTQTVNPDQQAQWIVDKQLENYLHMGLIRLLFPGAIILHSTRHPLDTCLSCYFHSFPGHYWANSMDSVAKTYSFYREMIAYWQNHSLLASIKPLDIAYESLVTDQQAQASRLFTHCKLNWDPAYLSTLGQGEQAIQTSSLWQARQPIYQSSTQRWRAYAPHIKPLAKKLERYLAPADSELFQHLPA